MALSIQFLGTGTSVGVPQIGCTCPVCSSTDFRDKRRRTGAYVCTERAAFLIDTPPEMRQAAIELGITKVEAVVLTHCHMDHIAGFDDVRRFNTLNGQKVACKPTDPGANGRDWRIVGQSMRCFAAPETIAGMRQVFPYVSPAQNAHGLYRPMINFEAVAGDFHIADAKLTPLPVEHGPRTNGYLIDCDGARLAYISDCASIPESTLALMTDVDVLVLDCLRERAHPTHLNRERALEYVEKVRPRRTYLIHMCHEVMHADFEAALPAGVKLAYDGLKVTVG